MYVKLSDRFDLILFAGQSNMAGRGCVEDAAVCPPGVAWEYRAVTDPDHLHPLIEPFGQHENIPGLIDDGGKKTGSMVSAFVAEYHRLTGRSVVGVSASKGGTSSQEWRDGLVQDAATRLEQATAWLKAHGMTPQHTLALWCQGETDGDYAVPAEEYRRHFEAIWLKLRSAGASCCGLIQIGHFNRTRYPEDLRDEQYDVIRKEQLRIAGELPEVFLAGSFAPYEQQMKDAFHYCQRAYNDVGMEAAQKAADYLRNIR